MTPEVKTALEEACRRMCRHCREKRPTVNLGNNKTGHAHKDAAGVLRDIALCDATEIRAYMEELCQPLDR